MTGPRLGTILLIDDCSADTYANRRVLGAASVAQDIRACDSADAALAYLRSPGRPRVDLILVDVNMPCKNGFEFADDYQLLDPELKAGAPVVMLSASLNPSDLRRAENHPAIDGFMEKPVNVPELLGFLSRVAAPATAKEAPRQ
jgi:CheY-like chemotaxis protein